MAGEIQTIASSGKTVYAIIRDSTGQVWNTASLAFQAYATGTLANYTISMVEQGTASGFYTGTFPAGIGPGVYSTIVKQQQGGSASETDPVVSVGDIQWSSTVVIPLSQGATSGQVASLGSPTAYGEMIQNFPFKMVSSADHVTPFTSGIVSGMISRNGGAFGPLQSGAFTEISRGWYSLQSLTSGDLSALTVALSFTANGISGGTADTRDFSFILQKSG